MRNLHNIQQLHGVPVLVRAPLNVPIENNEVVNDFRLRQTIPTIEFLTRAGAKVIICGHIGRAPTETLEPVYRALAKRMPHVSFSPVAIGPKVREAVRALHSGDVLMLENLRRYPGEIKNDPEFARELASPADIFVQDAFDTAHREHASIVGVPKFLPSYAGLLLAQEVSELTIALTPKHSALAVIGGAKFSTKEPVLEKLLSVYDHVVVGGALANDFLAAKGYSLGASLMSGADQTSIKTLLADDRLVIPLDAVVALPKADATASRVTSLDTIDAAEAVLDSGPQTNQHLATLAQDAKTILWNGPLGRYESGFTDGTKALAQAIAASGAHSIVGGGDTIAAIEELGITENFSFISTGGGSMLAFLTKGTLPGIEALSASS